MHHALQRDHDGSVLDGFQGFLGNPQAANGAGILRHVLGDQRGAVENGLAAQAGLNADSISQLLEILAPMVMGALGKTQRAQHLDPNSLSAFLGGQQQSVQSTSPDMMGLIGGLLDSNNDGNIVDDLGKIAGALFGGR